MIKRGNPNKKYVDSSTRAKLIRKGNEFFTDGKIKAAEKIFISVDYKDGLVRLGDYYLENKDIVKSCEMYFMSENNSKINSFLENSARVIEKLLKEDNNIDVIEKIIIEK
jgi:hypothetical protein